MPILTISQFSCLKEASFSLAPVNVIIGPQGSGKSVTTKMFYFFTDLLGTFVQSVEKGDSLDEYKRIVAKQFTLWFPPSAWGPSRSNINYSAGEFTVRVLRKKLRGKLTDEVSVTFSDWFNNFYQYAKELYGNAINNEELDDSPNAQVPDALDRIWRVRDLVNRRLGKELEAEFFSRQTFIPAGRAFFTSIGRLVAGFEQAGSLDPITIKFARLFASLRDRNAVRHNRLSRLGSEYIERRSVFMHRLFGGEIKFEDDAEFVETDDGRKVPFSSLSSGQQELLPMWSLMEYFSELDTFRSGSTRSSRSNREIVYIEEPEAHLFPSAQSFLMEFLIGSVVSDKTHRNLVITTHSPYIMGKLNVFLKAGQLARRRKRNLEINEIVPRDCWLNERQISAFAIQDCRLVDIMDDDGFIDGRYLDSVSEDISRDFSRLLQIESEM